MIEFDNYRRIWLAVLIYAVIGIVGAGDTIAQDVEVSTPVIAVIDVKLVLRQAKAAASIREQIDDYSIEFQSNIDELKIKLETENRELQEQRTLLAPEVFAQRRQDLDRGGADLQDYVKTVRNILNKAMKQAGVTIESALKEEIGVMAEARGGNLVLVRSHALYASPMLDLTDEALKRLDVRLPTVPIDLSTPEKLAPTP